MPWSGFWNAVIRLCTFRNNLLWTPGAVCKVRGQQITQRGYGGTPLAGRCYIAALFSQMLRRKKEEQGHSQSQLRFVGLYFQEDLMSCSLSSSFPRSAASHLKCVYWY